MEGQLITQILSIALIVSIIVLFVLILLFIIISIKNRKEQKKLEQKIKENRNQNTQITSQIGEIETKTYTPENVKKFLDFDEIKDNMIITKGRKKASNGSSMPRNKL